jgi:hypothetical protein
MSEDKEYFIVTVKERAMRDDTTMLFEVASKGTLVATMEQVYGHCIYRGMQLHFIAPISEQFYNDQYRPEKISLVDTEFNVMR